MLESSVEDHLIKCAKARGGEVRKVAWIGRRGAPDRLVMIPELLRPTTVRGFVQYARRGRAFFVELKCPGKKPTAAQAREHQRMRDCGMLVYVASTKEEVEALFK